MLCFFSKILKIRFFIYFNEKQSSMYEISIIYPVTTDAIKKQDDSLTDDQSIEVLEYLKKTRDIINGLSWIEILRAINICRTNWHTVKKQK